MKYIIKSIYRAPPVHTPENGHGRRPDNIPQNSDGRRSIDFDTHPEDRGSVSGYGNIDAILGSGAMFDARGPILDGLDPGSDDFFKNGDNPAIRSNLKTIVEDDRQWANFTGGVLDQASNSTTMQTLRKRLFDGFDQKIDFDDMTNLISGYARDQNQKGVAQRIDLWLQNPEFFNILIEAIQRGDLAAHPELYTDPLLFQYIGTFDE